jgi:hypothetical protein
MAASTARNGRSAGRRPGGSARAPDRVLGLYRSDGINVDWAYPAAAAATPHRVRFTSGETLYAA